MKECASCGYQSDEDFSVCPECGEKEAENSPQEFVEPIERQSNLYEYKSCGVPDTVDTSEQISPVTKALPIKSIKIIALCVGILLVSFGVVLLGIKLFSSTPTSGEGASSLSQETTESGADTQQLQMKPTQYKMSGEFSDYQIMIDGNVYQIHMTVGEILDSGWIFTGGVSNGVLPSGEKAEIILKSADGAQMQITAVNFNNSDTPFRECIVSEIKVERSNNPDSDISIMGDLKLGFASMDSLQDVVGICVDAVSAGRGYVLTYTESETKIAQFTFDKNTENLISIRFCDTKKPDDFGDDYWENADHVALPYPTDPDVTPTSGIISIDGEVYRLPISVDVLISRGWTAELDGSASKIPSGGRAYATFTRGNAVLTGVDVYNPTISEARIEDCSVVSVSSSSAEGWVVFPLGVKAGISEAAFLLSVEGIEYEFDDTYFDEYVFSDDKYTFVVNIDSTTGKVIYVSSSYNY